ncbi:MAG TPA: hypothetical protein GXZ53_02945 [Firmicutes bacterium]|jgi:hypothetical protein|nr:hypothetical protein [Bacillota bacterium]
MLCENIKVCLFYNDKMDIDSALGKMYKRKYCEGDKTICARYIVVSRIGRENVPANLYPNMHERAKKILEERGLSLD